MIYICNKDKSEKKYTNSDNMIKIKSKSDDYDDYKTEISGNTDRTNEMTIKYK